MPDAVMGWSCAGVGKKGEPTRLTHMCLRVCMPALLQSAQLQPAHTKGGEGGEKTGQEGGCVRYPLVDDRSRHGDRTIE